VREREEEGIVEVRLESAKGICRGVALRLVLWGSYQKPHKGHKSPGSDVMRGRRAWRMRGRRLHGANSRETACEGKGEHATGHHMDKGFRLSLHRTTPPPSPLCTLSACDEINGGLERWGTKLHSAAGISSRNKCNQQEQKSQTERQGSIKW
jgi:hypothetical protein